MQRKILAVTIPFAVIAMTVLYTTAASGQSWADAWIAAQWRGYTEICPQLGCDGATKLICTEFDVTEYTHNHEAVTVRIYCGEPLRPH